MEPWKRPQFAELVHSLEAMKYSALMKVILMDLSRLDLSSTTPAATTDTTMDREALENILGMVCLLNTCTHVLGEVPQSVVPGAFQNDLICVGWGVKLW